MPFTLKPLPYNPADFQNFVSPETFSFHHGRHLQAYIDAANKLIAGTDYAAKTLEEIMLTSSGPLFNQAAQAWNHDFYFACLTPEEHQAIPAKLKTLIESNFGSVADFTRNYAAAAAGNFGSGWTWLVKRLDGQLEIYSTSNAGTPLTEHLKPLMVIDVWEHAYYIDYRNARAAYIQAFFDKLVNWDFVQRRFNGEPCDCDCRGEEGGCCCGACGCGA